MMIHHLRSFNLIVKFEIMFIFVSCELCIKISFTSDKFAHMLKHHQIITQIKH